MGIKMAKIYIQPISAKSTLHKEGELDKTLSELHRTAASIKTGLRYKISAQHTISERLQESIEQIAKEQMAVQSMRSSFEQIIMQYEKTECRATELVTDQAKDHIEQQAALQKLADAYDTTTKTFDDDKNNGTYGADQGDMNANKKGMWFFGFRWFEDEDLYAYIRLHSRYQNYSQTQIAELMEQINSEGCGYVAIVNSIFVAYEGREDEFERVFGFPMYDKKGQANYNYLLVDFYANTDDRYFIDEPYGATALVNDVILEYVGGRENEFQEKYGCPPLIDENKINPVAQQKILDEYQDSSMASKKTSGTTIYSLENRFKHYLKEKDITCSSESLSNGSVLNGEAINKYMDDGKSVNILVSDFNLYNEKGTAVQTDVGGHWMTITDVTEDGRYIVSSWGKRYYLNPSELNDANFFITKIEK